MVTVSSQSRSWNVFWLVSRSTYPTPRWGVYLICLFVPKKLEHFNENNVCSLFYLNDLTFWYKLNKVYDFLKLTPDQHNAEGERLRPRRESQLRRIPFSRQNKVIIGTCIWLFENGVLLLFTLSQHYLYDSLYFSL